MSVTSKIPNVVFLGLLVSLCLLSDRGFGTAETIVDINPHVVLEVGTTGILPCRIQRRGYTVEWKRQLSSETELLVSLDTYLFVGKRDGPGYKAGLFNMTDDYSLVIKDVKVQDEGLYICSFSDYQTGKPFQNSTRVSVQAFPDEPFPTIEECIGNFVEPGVCTLAVHAASNLSCLVEGYYPNIDLFFLHGSEKVPSIEREEWDNADGTKNKITTIPINVSDEVYQCVASALPGIGGNRSVSITVQVQDRPQTLYSEGPNAPVIAVPVIVGICLCILIAAIFKYRGYCKGWCSRDDEDYNPVPRGNPVTGQKGFCSRDDHDYSPVPRGNPVTVQKGKKAPEGPVSKLELWNLIKYAEEKGVFEKLRKVVRRLLNTDAVTLQTNLDFYESLSTWKKETPSNCNQRERLYSVCNELGMADITRKLIDIVMDASPNVSKATLLHILWEIKEPSKITELLKDLHLDHKAVAAAVEQGRREVVYRAHRELVELRKRKFDINPLVILSLKLDDLGCETNFFKLPSSEMEDFDVNEMRGRISQFCGQHLTNLLKAHEAHGGIHGEDVPYHIETLVQENHESLFDTIQMLRDWVINEECSNYDIRKKIRKGAEASLQRDPTVDKWPPDDELKVIASFLPPKSMEPLCSKLGVKTPLQEANEEERFQVLAKWRDNAVSSKDLKEIHTELIAALKEIEREGLVPRVKGHLVYKAELLDLAFHLFAQDLLPFTEALGISAVKLVDYRPTFQPSHITKGTIGLVCKLLESGNRSDFFNLSKCMPYPNVIASGVLAHGISYGELYAVYLDSPKQPRMQRSNSIGESISHESLDPVRTTKSKTWTKANVNAHSSISSKETSHTKTQRDATCNVPVQKLSEYDIFEETTESLATMLSETVEVKEQNIGIMESMVLKHFKRMREQSCLAPFSCRLALAKALRIIGNDSQAYALIRGDYKKGNIAFTFIYDILRNMTPDQLYDLHSLIRNTGSTTFALPLSVDPLQEQGWFRMTDAVCLQTSDWIGKWIQHWNSTKREGGENDLVPTREIAKKHKELNDKLVDLGFIDLAREIMICEQQLI